MTVTAADGPAGVYVGAAKFVEPIIEIAVPKTMFLGNTYWAFAPAAQVKTISGSVVPAVGDA